jgi:hypothetical protein
MPGGEPAWRVPIWTPVHRGVESFELELDCEPLPGCVVSALRAGGRRGCRGVSHRGYWWMKAIRSITPREAKAVWDSLKNPSTRSVARALSQAGRRVHHSTIARWWARGWRPVASGEHPIEAAREALDIAAT